MAHCDQELCNGYACMCDCPKCQAPHHRNATIADLRADVERLTKERDEARAELERLRAVIRTGGAMYRAERAAMGVPGGLEEE